MNDGAEALLAYFHDGKTPARFTIEYYEFLEERAGIKERRRTHRENVTS